MLVKALRHHEYVIRDLFWGGGGEPGDSQHDCVPVKISNYHTNSHLACRCGLGNHPKFSQVLQIPKLSESCKIH